MKQDVCLFIEGKEIEFSQDPKLLLNYVQTDLNSPTVVRNSFTKSIDIEGTNANNDVFDEIWRLDRYQITGQFNPMKKANFELFVNGELFKRGYAKLDKITKTNNTVTYSITLYGGLGEFFYNLMYDEDSSEKKKLSDLIFSTDYVDEPDFNFTINKDTVYQAWAQLTSEGSDGIRRDIWDVINFCPAYNGIPEDFSADKILVNNNGMTTFLKTHREGGISYTPILNGVQNQNGFSLATAKEDLTEWETFDLRSYLQRPVLNMERVIEACCQPENNGGFEVDLDSHFFNTDNDYYRNAWVTLPMLQDLDGVGGGETEEVSGATITKYGDMYNVEFNTSSISSINNVDLDLTVKFNPSSSTNSPNLYTARSYKTNPTFTLQGSKFPKTYKYNTGIILQLLAYGEDGEVVGKSKAYLLATEKNFPNSNDALWKYFGKEQFEFIQGYWKLIDGEYVFVNNSGVQTNINFKLNNTTNFSRLAFKVETPHGYYIKYVFTGKERSTVPNSNNYYLYSSKNYSDRGNRVKSKVMALDRVNGSFGLEVSRMSAIATDYSGLFSETKITKEKILSTDSTPADYLLSFCKLFGLYFYYDSTEESSDPEKYPAGIVHIMDRHTFYTGEVVDLSKYIDFNKKLNITPTTASAKWYLFNQEQIESEVNNIYLETYGYDYGRQIVNTSYNFDSSTNNLYSGTVFKGGIMAREKDKYYKKPLNGVAPYCYNGLTYELYAPDGDEFKSTELEISRLSLSFLQNINNYQLDFYDNFPKLVCHTEDNSASDGSGVLLFFRGAVDTIAENDHIDYWITDDLPEMIYLNDAEPCWILTASEFAADGRRIAWKKNYMPLFSRDIIYFEQEGNIVHSWDFGHPQVTFVPNTYSMEGSTIYDHFWKNYISDLYDVNNRILTCYVQVNADGKPWTYWMRRFYWFENCLWRLNAIKDLNMGSFDTTQMEFVKVIDPSNYDIEEIVPQGDFEITLDTYEIGCEGGTVNGTVKIASGGGWFASDKIDAIINPRTGRGYLTTFVLTIPANETGKDIEWDISMEDDFDDWHRVYLHQESCGTPAQLTGITLDNLTWVTDIPATGGTATKDNCSYNVIAHYDDTTTNDITNAATVTGDLVVTATTATTRESVGTLTLTATYSGFTATASTTAYQAAYTPTPPTPSQSFVRYYFTSDLDKLLLNQVNLIIEITSNSGSTDSATIYATGTMTDSGDIDVILALTGDTQLTFNIDVNDIRQVTPGDFSIRAAYYNYDTGYQPVVVGDTIHFTKNFAATAGLYINLKFTPSNQLNRSAVVEEEQVEDEDETESGQTTETE